MFWSFYTPLGVERNNKNVLVAEEWYVKDGSITVIYEKTIHMQDLCNHVKIIINLKFVSLSYPFKSI